MTTLKIRLPTLHPDQVRAYRAFQSSRFLAMRCGRRWGKTELDKILASSMALRGDPVGWFTPVYKLMSEAYNDMGELLEPAIKQSSKTDGVIRLHTKGRIDFWTLENEHAGRSRKYKLVIIDEAAFAKENMLEIWERAIKPTLLDLRGKCLVTSNTNGSSPSNFLYQICHEKRFGFKQFHAPTRNNPTLPADYVTKLREENHPLVYAQEYEAEFVDWSGVAFFALDKMLAGGAPVPYPAICDGVFAVIDTAIKDSKESDGTGVVFFATSHEGLGEHRLVVLDWDIEHIKGAVLEEWLPSVYERLEYFSRKCRARFGSLGVWIEDKVSGTILLQQAERNGWEANAIDTVLTSVGKSARAISVSGYYWRGMVKVSQEAYDKQTLFKGITRNHFVGQVVGFSPGEKDPKAQDDLLDCFCYGLSIALGDNAGI